MLTFNRFYIIKEAKEVASKAIGFLEGKRPSSIAAAAILFIFNIHQTTHKQQDLANVAGISTNTLRNVYKELNKHIDQLPNHLFQIKANVHIAS
jgi:transcription initiation factor TFIIIB Brf1 subunit/transcription initiation factor TFIIB